MSETREFPMSAVLSVTTGKLLCAIDGLYDIMGFIMRDKGISTIGLAACSDIAKRTILAQHPQLSDIDASGIDRSNYREHLDRYIAQYGATLPLSPIPLDDAIGADTSGMAYLNEVLSKKDAGNE